MVRYLLNKKIFVIALIHRSKIIIDDIENEKNLTIIQCDLANILENPYLNSIENIDVFYHFAWRGASGEERGNVVAQLENIKNTMNCIEYCNRKKISKFITCGTIAEKMEYSFLQDFLLDKKFIYTLTKQYLHKILRIYSKKISTKVIWCTLCGVYGEGDMTTNLVNYTLQCFQKHQVPEFGLGEEYFDFINIKDCVRSFYFIGIKENHHTDYYLGSGNPRKLKEYLLCMKETFGYDAKIKIGVRKDDGIKYKKEWFDTSVLEEDIGVIDKISFREGIQQLINKERKRENNIMENKKLRNQFLLTISTMLDEDVIKKQDLARFMDDMNVDKTEPEYIRNEMEQWYRTLGIEALIGRKFSLNLPYFTREEVKEAYDNGEMLICVPKGIDRQQLSKLFHLESWAITNPCVSNTTEIEDFWFKTKMSLVPEYMDQEGRTLKKVYQNENKLGLSIERYMAFVARMRYLTGETPDEKYKTWLIHGRYDGSSYLIAGFDSRTQFSVHGWMPNFHTPKVGIRYAIIPDHI